VLSDQDKWDEAIAAYRQAIQFDPEYASPYKGLGIALSHQRQLDEAIVVFRQAIQLDPESVVAYYGLGEALRGKGKLDEAIAALRQAIQLDPKFPDAYNGLGVALADQGKLDEAIENYNQALRLPDEEGTPASVHALAYYNLANTLGEQGKPGEAIAAYRQAIQIAPRFAATYTNLGNVLSRQGELEEAIAAYRQALSFPDVKSIDTASTSTTIHAVAHNNLGATLAEQDKYSEAIAEYQKAIALDPNYAPAQINLRENQRLLALQRNPQSTVADDWQFLPTLEEESLLPVLRATARIIVETSGGTSVGSKIGTGWVVKREGNTVWVVTNRHVILSNAQSDQPSNAIAVEFYSQLPAEKRPRYTATVEQISPADDTLDLAVIKITGIPADIQPLQPSPKRISLNTRVRVIGHPYTDPIPWHSSSGGISNYAPDPNNPWLTIDASVAEGNSGGPVVNDDSQIVAMMVTIIGAGDIATDPNEPSPSLQGIATATRGFGRAYRIDMVMEKLRSWRILN
jgi:protein O-GlcNAc transferase